MHLVLLPGLDGTGELFAPFIEALPRGVQVTVISYPKNKCLSWDELLQLVLQTIPSEEPVILVAESFSGPFAIKLASLKSHEIQGLVLCCSFASSPLLRWFSMLPAPGLMFTSMPRFIVRNFLSGPSSSPKLLSEIQSCVKSVSPRVLSSRVRMTLKVDVLQELKDVSIPVLYLAGRQDRVVSSRSWKQVQSRLPKSTLVTLDGPHLLLQRLPDAAVREIMKFSDEVIRQPSSVSCAAYSR